MSEIKEQIINKISDIDYMLNDLNMDDPQITTSGINQNLDIHNIDVVEALHQILK